MTTYGGRIGTNDTERAGIEGKRVKPPCSVPAIKTLRIVIRAHDVQVSIVHCVTMLKTELHTVSQRVTRQAA